MAGGLFKKVVVATYLASDGRRAVPRIRLAYGPSTCCSAAYGYASRLLVFSRL